MDEASGVRLPRFGRVREHLAAVLPRLLA